MMAPTKTEAREVLDTYIRAWQEQDPDLIVTIFTEGATYHERVMGDPIPDREAIREYWQTKVVGGAGEHPLRAAEASTWTVPRSSPSGWPSSTTSPRESASGCRRSRSLSSRVA